MAHATEKWRELSPIIANTFAMSRRILIDREESLILRGNLISKQPTKNDHILRGVSLQRLTSSVKLLRLSPLSPPPRTGPPTFTVHTCARNPVLSGGLHSTEGAAKPT